MTLWRDKVYSAHDAEAELRIPAAVVAAWETVHLLRPVGRCSQDGSHVFLARHLFDLWNSYCRHEGIRNRTVWRHANRPAWMYSVATVVDTESPGTEHTGRPSN